MFRKGHSLILFCWVNLGRKFIPKTTSKNIHFWAEEISSVGKVLATQEGPELDPRAHVKKQNALMNNSLYQH